MQQQKILIIDQGLLSKEIEANSNEELLIDVIHVNLPNKKYPYSFFDKYINILNRFFLNSHDYPKNREYNFINNSFLKDLRKGLQKKYDYVLITRPDNFNSKFLLEVSKASKNIIGYVWDSMSDDKYKKLIKTRSNFKYLYCYDQNSIINYPDLKLEYTTNFYYHTKDINLNLCNKNIFLSYIGNNLDARKELILKILQNIGITSSSNKDNIDIALVERTLKMSSDINIFDNFKITNQKVATEEYLKILSNSFISLDLIPSFNNGFSFRLFEASYTMTKLITTNQNAAQLQFYHPDNIFIYNDETKHLLTDFTEKPYYNINSSLIEYYRIDNWLKRALKLN